MSGELLRRLLFSCEHQFSWPRQAEDGQHYQVCVRCGTVYRYDWSRMRRVARVPNNAAPLENQSRRRCKAAVHWTPRPRRLRYQVPVRLRAAGSAAWVEGTTENVSASGLLLRAPIDLPVGTPVELILEMPHEITGREVARVLCRGAVARTSPVPADRNKNNPLMLACTVEDYRFVAGSHEIAS